jgi:hypothetical protein
VVTKMKLFPVVILLAAIAVGMVHVRRRQVACANETQRFHSREVDLRRKLWDQHVRLGYLTSPRRVAGGADGVGLTDCDDVPRAGGVAPAGLGAQAQTPTPAEGGEASR